MVQGMFAVEQEVKRYSNALRTDLWKLAESGYRPLWSTYTFYAAYMPTQMEISAELPDLPAH